MFGLFGKKVEDNNIYSPCDGEMFPLEELKDGMFSEKMLGDGCAFNLQDGMIYAPVTGTITAVFPTKHAIGITAKNGLEILLHIGLDSEKINSKNIMQYVVIEQDVKAGKPIMYVDIDEFKKENISPLMMLIITNSNIFKIQQPITRKNVKNKDALFEAKYSIQKD